MNYKVADLCFSVEGSQLALLEDFEVAQEASWSFNFTDDFDDHMKVHPYLTSFENKAVISGLEDQMIRGRIDSENKVIELAKGPNEPYLMRSALHWALEKNNAFLIHACALSMKGKGFLIPGASGAGKSTIASRFTQEELISDEIVVVQEGVLHKTPFRKGLADSEFCHAVLFPVHADEFALEEVSAQDAFSKILPRVSMGSEDKELGEELMDSLLSFLMSRPLFNMSYSLSDDLPKLMGEQL